VLRRHPLVLAAGLVLLLAVSVVALTGLAVWRAAHRDGASQVDHADVILVLGAAQYNGDPSPVFVGRLEHAALLYQEGRADTVMVLGGSRPGDRFSEAEAGRSWLIGDGLPDSAVVASPVGSSTLESLQAAARWMHERELSSAFLVSDPWHNLRVERMASDLGIDGYASATWSSAARSEHTRFEGYLRETFAYLYYRLFGR
jgi:vancomycin permeability regulator SanA